MNLPGDLPGEPALDRIQDRTWILSCPRCHNWRTLREAGGVRIGAKSVGKRTLGWCSHCRWFRLMRLQQPPQIPHHQIAKMVNHNL